MDYYEIVTVNGRKYKLQHPGNREVLKLQAKLLNTKTGEADLVPLLEYCFEYIIVPQGHDFKPDFDNLHPSEFQEWAVLLPKFLRGDDISEHRDPQKGTEHGTSESQE